jgi:hypothetical protein
MSGELKGHVPNLVMRRGGLYFRARVHGKLRWHKSPYQGSAAITRQGNPTDAVTTALAQWMGSEREAAELRRRNPDAVPNGRIVSWEVLDATYPAIARLQRAVAGGRPSEATAEANRSRMRTLVGQMGLSMADPMDAATPQIFRAWLARRQDGMDDQQAARDRHSASTLVRMASSCWAQWTREYYRDRGIIIPPCLDRWPAIQSSAEAYELPPAELRKATAELGARLEQEHPAIWLAFALMRYHGMRPGCALRARWDWWRPAGNGAYSLRWQPGKTSRGGAGRWVDQTVSAELWGRLDACRKRLGHDGEYVIPGSDLERQKAMETINEQLRAIGWDSDTYDKAGYELRKLFVSEIFNRHGLAIASAYSGDLPTTIQTYYAAADPARHPELRAEWFDGAAVPAPALPAL